MRPSAIARFLFFTLALLLPRMLGWEGPAFAASYEQYFRYLDGQDRPSEADSFFSKDVQGITHDNQHWYITAARNMVCTEGYWVQRDPPFPPEWICTKWAYPPSLWRIPVEYDLATVSEDSAGVIAKSIEPESIGAYDLHDQGCSHPSAPSYYFHEPTGKGYVVVPYECDGSGNGSVRLLAFYSRSLELIGYKNISDQNAVGWCAINPKTGILYTTDSQDSSKSTTKEGLYRYWIDWGELSSGKIVMEHLWPNIRLLKEDETSLFGEASIWQGGVFSNDGAYFYAVSGYFVENCPKGVPGDAAEMQMKNGIHVFDMSTEEELYIQRVTKSTSGYGLFNYQWEPDLMGGCEEPQGLTIWDLDDDAHPKPSHFHGQLHVLMLDNEWAINDQVYLKHYTNTIYVDSTFYGEDGRDNKPFQSIGQALDYFDLKNAGYPFWTQARLRIKSGSYPESLTFRKPIQVVAGEGPVVFGLSGRISIAPGAALAIKGNGIAQLH
jgi:hypothetical protein